MIFDWDKLKENLKGNIIKEKKDWNDPREWKLSVDENGNGSAVIRLLPGKGGNTPPIVRLYEHAFCFFYKGSGKKRCYIKPSPSTIGKPCPVSDLYFELGEIGTDEAKQFQKRISRSTKFISNIYIVKDPANPENVGKVFYWKYGIKLFEKFQAKLEPSEQQQAVGIKPVQLFDPMKGADIILVAKQVGGFRNYDDTNFGDPRALFATEEEMWEVVNNQCIDLNEFLQEDYYEEYEKLRNHLAWVIAGSDLEKFVLSYGSKVITKPYSEKGATVTNPGIPNQTQVTQPQVQTPQPQPQTQTVQNNQTPQVQTQPKPEPQPQEQPQAQSSQSSSIDDIEKELEDLLNI